MKKNSCVMSFLFIVLLSVSSCQSSASGVDASLELTGSDSGGSFTLHTGGTLRLSLPEAGSTGFGWEFESRADSILELVDEDLVLDSDLVGAGGVRTYEFKAFQEGVASLELAYRRPWLKNEPPAKTFRATISVE